MPINQSSKTIPKEKLYSTRALIRDIFLFLKPYRGKFFLASVFRVMSDIIWLYPAYALASLIDFLSTYHRGDSLSFLWIILGFWAIAIFARNIFRYYAKKIGFTVSEQVNIDAAIKTTNHMFELDVAWHEHENTGNKLKKIVRGAESMDKLLRMWINNVLEIVINFIGILFIISRFDNILSLFIVIFIVSYYIISSFFNRRGAATSRIVNAKEEDIHGLFFEALNNIRSVKVLAMGRALSLILKKETGDLFEKIIKRIFWFQSGSLARSIWGELCNISIIIFIIHGIIEGKYAVGFLILFYNYFDKIWMSVRELSDISEDFIISKYSVGRMMKVLNEPIRIDKEENKVVFPQKWEKITLKNVTFSYAKNIVLQDISFNINRGEKVGIVGLSGAGKSTLFKLLLKEHENFSGEILVDSTPLPTIGKNSYFKDVAAVLQDTEVFNFSLKDNITLANIDEAGNEELLDRALKVSHTHDFLHKLPKGVLTTIGEKGVRLSGGERQRLGIARAVFKNPQILLLDEATSHLDIESEEKIRASLHEFFQSVTAVVIAHRLTTIKEMDRIIVIEGGKIIEEGTFDDLYKKQGRFFELWEKQKL